MTEETQFIINHKAHHSFAIQCSIGNQEKNYNQELDFPQQRCWYQKLCCLLVTQKALQLPFFLLLLLFLVAVFGQTDKKFVRKRFFDSLPRNRVTKIAVISLDTLNMFLKKLFPTLLFPKRMAHIIHLFMATSIHNIREGTRNSQKLRYKLIRRWKKIQWSKERKIELISKKLRGKEKVFKRSNWLMLYAGECNIKTG